MLLSELLSITLIPSLLLNNTNNSEVYTTISTTTLNYEEDPNSNENLIDPRIVNQPNLNNTYSSFEFFDIFGHLPPVPVRNELSTTTEKHLGDKWEEEVNEIENNLSEDEKDQIISDAEAYYDEIENNDVDGSVFPIHLIDKPSTPNSGEEEDAVTLFPVSTIFPTEPTSSEEDDTTAKTLFPILKPTPPVTTTVNPDIPQFPSTVHVPLSSEEGDKSNFVVDSVNQIGKGVVNVGKGVADVGKGLVGLTIIGPAKGIGGLIGGGGNGMPQQKSGINNNVNDNENEIVAEEQPQLLRAGEIETASTNISSTGECPEYQVEYNGACRTLLMRSTCPEKHWLVFDKLTGKGKCSPNKNECYWPRLPYGDKCVQYLDDSDCHPGMSVRGNKFGNVYCDCKSQHIFNRQDGNCYEAYRRGPCSFGQYFIMVKQQIQTNNFNGNNFNPLGGLLFGSGGSRSRTTTTSPTPAPIKPVFKPTCARNVCSQDGYACYGPNCSSNRHRKVCVKLRSSCDKEDGTPGEYGVNEDNHKIECLDPSVFNRDVSNTPDFNCRPGTKRGQNGHCHRDIKFDI